MCPVCTASPKESHQRKGDPTRCVPPLRCGQPAVLVRGARCGTRYALRASLEQPQRVSSRSTGAPTPVPPHALRSSAHREGDPRIGHPHGPSLRSAPPAQRVALAPARGGRAKQRPGWLFGCWMFGCPPPAGCACGGAVVGWHGRRSAHASCSDSPWLSERRAQRKASSTAHPATAPTQVCPVAQRRGRRLGVAFSLVTFFWRSKRKLLARRATPGFRPEPKHARQTSTPRLRQACMVLPMNQDKLHRILNGVPFSSHQPVLLVWFCP